jgi:hypothetical protein
MFRGVGGGAGVFCLFVRLITPLGTTRVRGTNAPVARCFSSVKALYLSSFSCFEHFKTISDGIARDLSLLRLLLFLSRLWRR